MYHLTGRTAKGQPSPVTADLIAHTLVNNGKYPQPDKAFSYNVKSKLQEIRHSPSVDLGLTKEVSPDLKLRLRERRELWEERVHPRRSGEVRRTKQREEDQIRGS